MLGKNNVSEYDQLDSKQTFGLRKLSVGVASVLLGSSWMVLNNVAHADTVDSSKNVITNAASDQEVQRPYVQNVVTGANTQKLMVTTPDGTVQKVEDNTDTENVVSNSSASSSANNAASDGNVVASSANNGDVQAAASGASQSKVITSGADDDVQSARSSAVRSNQTPNNAVINNQYGVQKYAGNAAQMVTGSLSVYDMDAGRQIGYRSLSNLRVGTYYDGMSDAMSIMSSKGYGPSAYNLAGMTSFSVSSSWYMNNFTIFISHNVTAATRTINIEQSVSDSNKDDYLQVASAAPTIVITQHGAYDAMDQQYHWFSDIRKGFSGQMNAPVSSRVEYKYGYAAVPTSSGADLMLNGHRVGSSVGLYSTGVPGLYRAAATGGYTFVTASFASNVVMSSSQEILQRLTTLNALSATSSDKNAITIEVKTPVSLRSLHTVVPINYVILKSDNPTGGAVPLGTWYLSYSYDQGFSSDLEQQIYKHIPKGFKLADYQDYPYSGSITPDTDGNKEMLSEYLSMYAGHKSLVPFAQLNRALATIYLVPDVNANLNYRYFDDANESNQRYVATAGELLRSGRLTHEVGTSNDPQNIWGNVSGIRHVSDGDLAKLQFINDMGADGKANGASHDKDLQIIHGLGYYTDPYMKDANGNDLTAIDPNNGQVFVFNNTEYSPADVNDKLINSEMTKVLLNNVQKSREDYNGAISNALSRTQMYLQEMNDSRSDTSSVAAARNQLSGYLQANDFVGANADTLSRFNLADTYNSGHYKPMPIYQGFTHNFDYFDINRKANVGSILNSGKAIGTIVDSSNDIFNAERYGNLARYTLRITMKTNVNGQGWPASYNLGPVSGFSKDIQEDGYVFPDISTANHFGDDSYKAIYAKQQNAYKFNIQTGGGDSFSVDDVTGDVQKSHVDAVYSSNPVLYFPQIKGYNLLVNGQKVSDEHFCLSPDIYLKDHGPSGSVLSYTIEYAPQKATVNVKIVDQHNNLLSTETKDLYVDSTSTIHGQELAGDFIQKYNDSHKDTYLELVNTDIPDQQYISIDDSGKTINYTVNVKVHKVQLIDDGMDKNVRTVYLVNRSDPDHSLPAITDIARIKVQKQVITDDQGEQEDTGGYVYTGLDTFDDIRNRINQAIGSTNWVVISGNQYLGSFTPNTPGGESITVEYG